MPPAVLLGNLDYGPVVRQIVGEQFAAISVSVAGDNIIVPGTVNLQIRVVKYSLVCAAAVVVTWKSSVAGAVTGPMSFVASSGISEPWCPRGIIQTALGEDLVLNLGGNVSVGGCLTYVLF